MKKIFCIAFMFCMFSCSLWAQDPMYSHAFMTPVYLNPGATGLSDYDFRVSAAFRRQWLLVPSGMQYFTLAADKYLFKHNGGIGLMANSEKEGFVNRTAVYGTLAKLLCFGSHRLSIGIQGGIINSRVDYSKLWFADQITSQGIISNLPSQVAPDINAKKWLPDFATGLVWIHNSGVMLGGSLHHLTQPDESFTNAEESKLPMRLTLTARLPWVAGVNIWDDDVLWIPGAIYSLQNKNKTLSLGCEVKTHYFNFGLWYRNNLNFRRSDAVFFTVTIDNFLNPLDSENRNNLRTGFAYDFTSNGVGSTRTAGSTEGAMSWEHLFNEDATSDNRCKLTGRDALPCPSNLMKRVY